jgi:hypothetical protein
VAVKFELVTEAISLTIRQALLLWVFEVVR